MVFSCFRSLPIAGHARSQNSLSWLHLKVPIRMTQEFRPDIEMNQRLTSSRGKASLHGDAITHIVATYFFFLHGASNTKSP